MKAAPRDRRPGTRIERLEAAVARWQTEVALARTRGETDTVAEWMVDQGTRLLEKCRAARPGARA